MNFNEKLEKYLTILKKDSILILIIIFIFFNWGLVYIFTFYTPKYKSDAKLWIKQINQYSYISDANINEQNPLSPVAQAGNPILTQMEILKSDRISEKVTEYLNENYPKQNPGKKFINLKNYLTLRNKVGTDIIEISFVWKDSKLSGELLNLIIDEYKQIVIEKNSEVKKLKRQYIDKKIGEIEEQLLASREKIRELKSKSSIMNLPVQTDQLTARLNDYNSILTRVKMEKEGAGRSIALLRKQLGLGDYTQLNQLTVSYDNKVLIQLKEDLVKANQELIDKKALLSDTNPEIVAVNDKISYLQKEIKKQTGISAENRVKTKQSAVDDPVNADALTKLVDAESIYQSLNAQESSLEKAINNINKVLKDLPEFEYNLNYYLQKENALSTAYDDLRAKQIEAHLSEAEAVSNIFSVDKPSDKGKSVPPSRVHYLLLFSLTGIFFSLFMVSVKNKIKDECDGENDIVRITGKPILGRLPWFKTPNENDEEFNNFYNIAFHNVLTNLIMYSLKYSAKIIAFTCPFTKTMNSKFVFSIAKKLAALNYKVVFIDNHFRDPYLLKTLNDEELRGKDLSKSIIDIERKISQNEDLTSLDVIDKAYKLDENLYIFANREPMEDPYSLFTSAAYGYLLIALKKKFDWIIIDTPSGMTYSEFPVIAKFIDGVIILTKYNNFKKRHLKNITNQFKDWDIAFLGSIIREELSQFKAKL